MKIDIEGSLELGRGVDNCRLLSEEIKKNEIMIMIHSPIYTSHSFPHSFSLDYC